MGKRQQAGSHDITDSRSPNRLRGPFCFSQLALSISEFDAPLICNPLATIRESRMLNRSGRNRPRSA
jgi:hypothetical protein